VTPRRRNALATALLVTLVLALFGDVVFFGRALYFRDITRFYEPARRVLAEIVRAGEFPFWNPYWGSGQPLAANPDYGTFYLPQWLIVLPPFEFWFRVHFVLHLCVAAAGAFWLLRRWTSRIESAFFGAIVYSLGGLTVSLTSLLPYLYCIAWLPWILWAVDRMIERLSMRRFAAAALFIALPMLGGEPVTIAQICLIVLVAAAVRRRSPRAVLAAAAAELTGALVAVVQIVPAADLLRDTARASGFSFDVVSRWSTPPLRLLDLLIPQFTGPGAEHFRMYWATAKYGWLDPFYPAIYFGVIPVALAIAGLTIRLPGRTTVAGMLGASIVLALGAHTPLLRLLYDAHLFRSFRYPEKFLILGLVPLMLFSAIAFDHALRGDRRILVRAAVVAGAIAALSAVLFVVSLQASYVPRFVAFWDVAIDPFAARMAALSRGVWFRAAIGASAAAGVLFYGSNGRRKTFARLAIALTLLDLASQRFSAAESIDGSFFRVPPQAARTLDRSTRLFHQADWYGGAIVARRYLDLPQMYWVLRNGLYPMIGAAWGVATAMNADIDRTFLAPATDFNEAMNELRARRVPQWFQPLMAMSAAGTRALYLPFDQQVRASAGDPHSIQPIIFLPVPTNPIFYFADTIVLCRTRREFVDAVARAPSRLRAAYTDLPPFVPANGRVIGSRLQFDRAEIDVDAAGRALLVCSITRHRYWSATIDGTPAALVGVNVQYQGVVVPAGRHTIRLRYRNPIVIGSAGVSLIAALGLIALCTVSERPGAGR